jgi:hypothetical protein
MDYWVFTIPYKIPNESFSIPSRKVSKIRGKNNTNSKFSPIISIMSPNRINRTTLLPFLLNNFKTGLKVKRFIELFGLGWKWFWCWNWIHKKICIFSCFYVIFPQILVFGLSCLLAEGKSEKFSNFDTLQFPSEIW